MRLLLLSLLVCVGCFVSCVAPRPVQYLEGTFDTTSLSKYAVKEPIIQRSDLISIIVFSDNPEATALYNLPNTGANGTGYLVDENGNIQLQGIGNIHVEGLTKRQLVDSLDSRLKVYLKNPYYNIRFLNFKVTLIGELTREGTYTIPAERVTIFEAIGLAGGLSVYARRENVMVVRESDGKREFRRLDLTNPKVFESPFYFLQQNDLVVVEQIKAKSINTDQTTFRNVSLATTIISTLIFVYSVFK